MSSQRVVPPPLPLGLPVPEDDGAADHLLGQPVPALRLPTTDEQNVDLRQLAEALVLYVFPKMGPPDEPDPVGWNDTPGARGCTQQSCAFRDLHDDFRAHGYAVAGISAQPLAEQNEAVRRLHLRFPLIADPDRQLGGILRLPLFEVAGMRFYKRLTLIARAGRIVKVFYPVFPPDANAAEALEWLRGTDE